MSAKLSHWAIEHSSGQAISWYVFHLGSRLIASPKLAALILLSEHYLNAAFLQQQSKMCQLAFQRL